MQVWEKLGKIYNTTYHAYLPTPILINNEIRVYFAVYDKYKNGRITFVDFDKNNLTKVKYYHNDFALNLGEAGTFDCNGVSPSCVLFKNSLFYLYYFGWQRTESVPFMLYTGLATSSDGVSFNRYSRTPILDRIDSERFIRDASYVVEYDNKYIMYYVTSPKKWGEYCVYSIESNNLYDWKGCGRVAIKLRSDEFGIGRPFVLKEKDDIFKMWYSYRGNNFKYKIGYAESLDGMNWKRLDDQISFYGKQEEWDNEMMCMSHVIDIDNERYMFYNGNGIGEFGFGLARLRK